ncbi:MAG: response regulator [Bacteroidales bacterium]
MNKPVKILLLEDVETDAQLAEREVKKTIPHYELKWVDNKEDFIDALNKFCPEIIISDYQLPSFDGLSALKIKQLYRPGIPFIIFTGSINEDTAVECMKAGATDYIIKEHLKRLGPAITSALEQKEILSATEKELIQSEEKFHRLADNMPDIIYNVGLEPNKHFEYINPAAETITGYSISEFYSNNELVSKIIHPIIFYFVEEQNNLDEYFSKPIVTKLVKKDDTAIWLELRNIPVYDETGKVIAIEGIAQDITEKRNAEILKQAIFNIAQASSNTKNLTELYVEVHKIISSIMPASNFYIAIHNIVTDEIYFPYFVNENREIPQKRKFGNGLTEYIIITGKSLLCNSDCIDELVKQRKVVQVLPEHSVWLGVPLKYDERTIGVMILQNYQNVMAYGEKERSMLEYVSIQVAKAIVFKKAEEQILKLSKAAEQSPVSIEITNSEPAIEYVNSAFSELTGYSFSEAVGKNPRFLKSGQTPTETYKDLWDKLQTAQTWKGEFINKKKDGTLFVESAIITPISDENGAIINYVAIKEDITLKKQIEQELIQTKEKAEESDRLKTAFLQNMSHEIRTPMNAIVGFSDLMELEISNPQKLREYIRTIKKRSNDLLDIINELLDIARIESKQIKLKEGNVNLSKTIEELFLEFSNHPIKQEKSNITLSYTRLPNRINANVVSDGGKLKQIFTNLIHNAIKFTPEGEVRFGFHSIDENSITFYVSDSGTGIPNHMKTIIFDRFRKSADESSYAQDGIGLGLSIVKGLLQIFNGKIWVESEENHGATFYFSIPYNPAPTSMEEQKETESIDYDWSNYSLLIVEDEPYNILLFIELLKYTNINCLVSKTGAEAIGMFTNSGKIDIVLMDLKLPDMSGYEIIKKFKEINPAIPIVAQTAYASENDAQKAIDAGCVGFISKPIKHNELLKIINKHLR